MKCVIDLVVGVVFGVKSVQRDGGACGLACVLGLVNRYQTMVGSDLRSEDRGFSGIPTACVFHAG